MWDQPWIQHRIQPWIQSWIQSWILPASQVSRFWDPGRILGEQPLILIIHYLILLSFFVNYSLIYSIP